MKLIKGTDGEDNASYKTYKRSEKRQENKRIVVLEMQDMIRDILIQNRAKGTMLVGQQ